MSVILISIFFAVLFFCLAVWNYVRGQKERVIAHLSKRLQGEPSDNRFRIQLQRREKLSDVPLLERALRKFQRVAGFQSWIRQSGIRLSPAAVLLISLVSGALILFLALSDNRLGFFLSLAAAAIGAAMPFAWVALKRSRRKKQFSAAFPNAVARMASSLRAGYSLQMAVEALVEDSGTIISDEFRKVLTEMEIGQGFEVALQKMLERIDTPDLRLFIASVTIQRESGGNLAELLDNLEGTIRERFELQKELEAATSQAKLSGTVLSLLPVFVGFFVFLINHDYILFLFQDPAGKKLLWFSFTGQCLGIFTIFKIVHIDM